MQVEGDFGRVGCSGPGGVFVGFTKGAEFGKTFER